MPERLHYTASDKPPKVVLTDFGKSRTRQSERDACNINTIMAKYQKTGVLPIANREAFFADVSNMGSYKEALDHVQMAQDTFMQLPAPVRTKFDNDPGKFLDFCADEANRDEMVQMGLLEEEEPAPEPEPEPPADPPTE